MKLLIELIKAALFGIIEGVTEWLPISSTGHLIILERLVQMDVSDAFVEMFRVVIQLGAILAVVVMYFTRLNPFAKSKSPAEKSATWQLWFKVIVAVIPSAVVGMLFDDWFDEHFYNYITVAITLIIYGVAFILIERRSPKSQVKSDVSSITYLTAFAIGLFQILAIIPGTSRSGSTILGAMLLGLTRTAAAEFSFFMAIPTMVGASGLKAVKFILDSGIPTYDELLILLVGSVVAFVVSIIAIRFLLDFVRKHTFTSFGVYRIILGAVVITYFLIAG
ncbi:MAG: undecaprenyl-diphosphate phosphatase [Clostridiales bacterium]|nr:undecaprenyl-diphosphate phosphatase [Clostridiales bacterium]